ncbi:MAG TPA: hypothetical protein VK724_10555 [Bryobacteraceae bacterium]|jgi:hypothetical protein|nr:hypothetical protein [Bryobacteraceae bacterium]
MVAQSTQDNSSAHAPVAGISQPDYNCTNMLPRILLILTATLALAAALVLQAQPPSEERNIPEAPPEDVRLPNGKLQRQEILKSDYQKSLADARALSKLADELKVDLEKNDYNVLSIATLKKVDEIDKLAKHIHDRMKRF